VTTPLRPREAPVSLTRAITVAASVVLVAALALTAVRLPGEPVPARADSAPPTEQPTERPTVVEAPDDDPAPVPPAEDADPAQPVDDEMTVTERTIEQMRERDRERVAEDGPS
jgi:hypothetical protein